MNKIQELYDITLKLKEVVSTEITSKNRQDVIDHMNHLIEKRSIVMKEVFPPYNEKELAIGKDLILLNKEIQSKMDALFQDLKIEMKQMKRQKKSNESYINPYKHIQTIDGLYMDRKK